MFKNWPKYELQIRWKGDNWRDAPPDAYMDVENCGCADRHNVRSFLHGLNFIVTDAGEQLDVMVFLDPEDGPLSRDFLKKRYLEWATRNGRCPRLSQCVEYFDQMQAQERSPALRLW